jgi:hypothetical protein
MASDGRILRMFAIVSVSMVWLSCSPCEDSLRSKAISGDNRLVASFYERNCGATTDFVSMVNVQSTSDRFDGEQGTLLSVTGRYNISLEWAGPRKLVITCANCARNNIFRQVIVLGDVDVSYNLPSSR